MFRVERRPARQKQADVHKTERNLSRRWYASTKFTAPPPPHAARFLTWFCLRAAEDTFLSAIINYTNSSTVHFKLSPTYVLYMACRYVLSPTYRPDMSPSERTHKVIAIVNKMVSMMEGVIQVSTTTNNLSAIAVVARTVVSGTSLTSSIIAVCFHAISLSTLLHNTLISYRDARFVCPPPGGKFCLLSPKCLTPPPQCFSQHSLHSCRCVHLSACLPVSVTG